MEQIEVIQKHIEWVNDRTIEEKADQLYSQEIEFITPTGDTINGLKAFMANGSGMLTVFPDWTITLREHEVNGSIVKFTMFFQGTFTGEMKIPDGRTIRGTGKHVEWQSQVEVTFQDGKISRWVTTGMQDFLSQLEI